MEFVRSLLERFVPAAKGAADAVANATADAAGPLSAANDTEPATAPELPPSFLGDNAIYFAYAALMLMATVPIVVGSRSSVQFPKKKAGSKPGEAEEAPEEEEEREFFRLEDAKMFPIIGSATLFGLYLLFTYFDKEYINYLLTAYFAILGVGAMVKAIMAASRAVTGWELRGDYRIDMWKKDKEILSYHFSVYLLCVIAFASILTVIYVLHKHWLLSNIYGEAFSTTAIQLLQLDSFWTGIILLSGLFLYDIFWVFFTPVMVTVAKSFDAPIKVVFPKDVGQLGLAGLFRAPPRGVHFTMLGLGDIVIPGIFIALCLRFDHHMHLQRLKKKKKDSPKPTWNFPKPYFTHCLISYVLGLVTTVVVMHTFQAAQPALLYLSPACILSVLGTAFARGEVKELFAYSEAPDEPTADGAASNGKTDSEKDGSPPKGTQKMAKEQKKLPAGEGKGSANGEASSPAGGPNKRARRLQAKLSRESGEVVETRDVVVGDEDFSVKEMAAFRASKITGAR
ncbi:minor histocompatibility antigen H13 [Hyaloraphidium curvatum]|nr:minor histocompatibility antigen H13 [Hyaloraphidium curvatum]